MSRQPMSRGKLLLLTLGISSAIHLALAAAYLSLDTIASAPSAQTVVEISLQQAAPVKSTKQPDQQPDQAHNEKVLNRQQDSADPQPVVNSESQPERPPTRYIETEPQPETVTESTTQTQSTEDTQLESTSELAAASLQHPRTGQLDTEHNAALETEKQNYLGLVAEHINSYKYYPRNAIRRGMEGQVEVSFDLQSDGSIENLRTQGEHSVLLGASQRSIEQALPMPPRTENLLSLGAIHIEFSMKYFLHEQ